MMHSFGYIWNHAVFKPLSEKEEASEREYLAQQDLERKAYEERLTREFEENKLIIAQLEKQLVEVLKSKPTGTPYKSKEDKRAARIARRAARGGQQYCEKRFAGFV
jgi:predicted nucleic acid-binding protein